MGGDFSIALRNQNFLMNSFDIVSRVSLQEVRNAINQTLKEVRTRYDLKKGHNELSLLDDEIYILTEDAYHLRSIVEILKQKLAKREVPLRALSFGKIERAGGDRIRQSISLQQGIPQDKAKEIVKIIKKMKLKVQSSIQGAQVRVAGKKLDDLQEVIQTLKESNLGINMQFTNYRSS